MASDTTIDPNEDRRKDLERAEEEKQEAQRELLKYQAFIDAALNAQMDTFFLFEAETGKARRWNRSFREITGYTDEEIASMPAPDAYYNPRDVERARAFLDRIQEEGTGFIELDLICKSGRVVPTEYCVSMYHLEPDEPRYVISIGRDISERKRAHHALDQSLQEMTFLKALGDHVGACLSLEEVAKGALNGMFSLMKPDAALLFIRDGEKLFVQGERFEEERFAQQITQIHRVGECFCGLAVSEGNAMYSTDIHYDPRCTGNECKRAGLSSFVALPLRARDEIIGVMGLASVEERDFEAQSTLLETAAKQVAIGLQNALYFRQVSDYASELETQIAKGEKAGAALLETELRYRALFEGAGDAIFVMKGERFVDCNQSSLEMFRCTREELLDHTPFDFSPPEQAEGKNSRDEALRRIRRAVQGHPQSFEWLHRRADGTVFNAEVGLNAVVLSTGTYVQAIVRDVTHRKEAEKALRESEERFRLMHEASVGAIGIHEGSIIRDVNQAAVDLTGYDYEELIGMSGLDLIDPAWRSVVAECIRSGYEQPYEVVGLRKDGSTYPLEIQGKQIPFQGRSFRLTEFRDITWRKEAERSLAESEEKYRLVVENASDAICIAQDERLPFSNPRAIETLGYTEKELKTLSFLDLIHPDDRQMVWERYRQRLAGGNPPGTYEFRVVSKQGTTIPVSLSSVGITWEGRPATLNFLRDITQQKEWDRRAHQIQRMEAIGTLAGGIAHNVNNTLMGIQGRASLMMMDKDVSHPDYEHLRGIEEYVRSAAELTRDLLGFAKGGKYQVKPVDVNALLVHENRMFTRTKKEICIREKFEQRLWTVEADKGQMRQMLMNLYVNAWQAMPSGGEIYVRTENVIVDEEDVQSIEIEAGRYVKISITDTGVGMDAATREKIFDPFFTTRDVNVGTGLGLASVYGIVKNHGGFINVYSERGRGATFTIYLPASNNKVVEEKQTSARLFKGEGTILLVDDEQMILDVGERFLHQVGYEVITARSGSEAVDLYEKNRERILLVVLDMIMPAMSGGETFDRLKAIDPNVKVLLSSGYSINGQAQEILDRGCCGFIQKPFQMEHLSQKLVEVLKPAS